MHAKETRLQEIIEGTKQYVIPLFQRPYSWTQKEWSILWKDISELAEMENPRAHFMGSIVNMPTTSVPHGVSKFLLIDGQQRLTTIFIILTILRNKARNDGNNKLADKIHNTLLVNQYEEGHDYYKLLPTQDDRMPFMHIINQEDTSNSNIEEAYSFFEKKIKNSPCSSDIILKILTDNLSIVSIVLGADDNPYLVFESLNAKGRTLTPADLIKNYFFMRIHQDKQDEVFTHYWQPMQTDMEKELPEYIRHFMMRKGGTVKISDVYYSLKEQVNEDNAIDYIRELSKYSRYYKSMIHPETEMNTKLRECFMRLNRIEATTAYPILLFFYGEYDSQHIPLDDFVDILTSLENYLIRRFVCDYKSNLLNKIFPTAYVAVSQAENAAEAFKTFLSEKGYPKDTEFKTKFRETRMYGGGERKVKTRYILERLENGYHHKEKIDMSNLSIEHIIPQTLSVWWQKNLGEEWEEVHEDLIDTIGNLTLTAYNSELSNADYETKRAIYAESHLEMNRHLSGITSWKKEQILERSYLLADKALEIWPYFGDRDSFNSTGENVSGSSPYSLEILGETFPVKNWRDVFELTLNTLAEIEPAKFEQVAISQPSYVGKDKNKFRAIRQLNNGYYIEVNQSASSILKNCLKAIQIVGLSTNDWKVNYSVGTDKIPSNEIITDGTLSIKEKNNNKIKEKCVDRVALHLGEPLHRHSNSIYMTEDKSVGFYFAVSKAYKQPLFERYWFGYRKKNELSDCRNRFYVFGCKNEKTLIVIPQSEIEKHLSEMNVSIDSDSGETTHWHVVFTVNKDRNVKWSLSKPEMHDIDVTDYLLE